MEKLGVRERILAAALEIAGSEGIAAITNRRIAAVAGVSLGSITYHFATQTDLLRAALAQFVVEEKERLGAVADQFRGQPLGSVATLVDRVATDLAFSAERIAPFEYYIQAGRDPELRGAATECFEAYDDLTMAVLGALDVPNREMVAAVLVGMVAGLQLRRLATGQSRDEIASAIVLVISGAFASAGRQ
ncbi:TetR family transcriptional regulator [Rhodococcus triatomae]|uniref:Regulatory protein, tetR family n=1 Tax=Rhodococcus triatomae TaxID=300028 RepID=A0A1G8L6Z4_9NOCA|nr:TetR/AcrR family transcriptional regulator [Rhodococcus triatomae]QNG20523.1 TetR family transcriptional regulator [Rhodococcus triatomae]QNG23559.1 TetR family transcriptional regulator [Rhodococcus triatomae]SDI51456.1 regulatory protein, tetR family [Rhodococcus triatomae]